VRTRGVASVSVTLLAEDLFSQFNAARNFVIHRGSLIRSSQVEVGLFAYRRLKLALSTELKTDEPSHILIDRIANSDSASKFVRPNRPFIGEQLGVRRVYREPKLSAEHDVLTASDMILNQLCSLVDKCHLRLGVPFDADAHDCNIAHDLEQHATPAGNGHRSIARGEMGLGLSSGSRYEGMTARQPSPPAPCTAPGPPSRDCQTR
jgi:hypothetical protein